MDWIGDKLSQLIEEGKKALGREVVVASEVQEDEVDDGTGAWVEEYPDHDASTRRGSVSRSGSIRRTHRPRNLPLSTSSSYPSPPRSNSHTRSSGPPSISSSPRTNRFDTVYSSFPTSSSQNASVPIPSLNPRASIESFSTSTSFKEDESAWQSPELRESMSKARARYLASRR